MTIDLRHRKFSNQFRKLHQVVKLGLKALIAIHLLNVKVVLPDGADQERAEAFAMFQEVVRKNLRGDLCRRGRAGVYFPG